MENKKNNTLLVIALTALIIILLFTVALFVLNSKGIISLTSNSQNNGTEVIENENNDNDSNENTVLTDVEAVNIVKKLYNDAIRHIHNEAVTYCGERATGEGAYLSIDGFGYTKSVSFKSLEELENYLKTLMTESLLSSSNYKKSVDINGKIVTSYVEKDGALYCNGWDKGGNMVLSYYVEDETIITVSNITNTSFNANIGAVYYDDIYGSDKNLANRTLKDINVTVVKQNNTWLLDKYKEKIVS